MMNWYFALSIRWKLQLAFFMVTMITTVYNRMLATYELDQMVQIARNNGVTTEIIKQLENNYNTYIFNSFWESGIEFVVQFFIIGLLASQFVKPILRLCQALKAVEKGDLTQDVKITSQDELGVLQKSFNEVLKSLNHIMREVDASAKEMEQSAYQIGKISHEIALVGHKEESRSADVNDATAQLQHISAHVQTQAQAATLRAKKIEERASEGIRMVQRNISEMKDTAQEMGAAMHKISELESSATQIHAIIATIKEIAEQTNLLALNAAIEAARAGEQGRGFAVVADEVRKLAERTTHAAGEVSGIIGQLGGKVQQVTISMNAVVNKVKENQKVAGDTATVIDKMAAEVAETAKANNDISISSGSQIDNVDLLHNTLNQLFETLKENSVKVDTTASIGGSLFKATANLSALMAGFSFDKTHIIEAAQHEKRTSPRISNRLLVQAEQDGKVHECSSLDISLTGMRLDLSSRLNDKQTVALEILLPQDTLEQYEKQTPLALRGKINWQNAIEGKNQCGITFENLTDNQIKKLRECFQHFNKTPEFSHNPSFKMLHH